MHLELEVRDRRLGVRGPDAPAARDRYRASVGMVGGSGEAFIGTKVLWAVRSVNSMHIPQNAANSPRISVDVRRDAANSPQTSVPIG